MRRTTLRDDPVDDLSALPRVDERRHSGAHLPLCDGAGLMDAGEHLPADTREDLFAEHLIDARGDNLMTPRHDHLSWRGVNLIRPLDPVSNRRVLCPVSLRHAWASFVVMRTRLSLIL